MAAQHSGVSDIQTDHSKSSKSTGLSSRSLPASVIPNATAQHHSSPLAVIPDVLRDQHYFLPDEVDIRAQPINLEPLLYPDAAYRLKISGRVRLRVFINESGEIDSVDIVASEPPQLFEDAAMTAILATHFYPAIKDGRRVKSQKLIEIDFNPNEFSETGNETKAKEGNTSNSNTTAP